MSELSDLYQEVILDHSRKPHNFGALPGANRKAEGYNPLCGDQVTLYIDFENDKIQDIRFEGKGCAISKSSASVMTDLVKGKTKVEAAALFDKFRHLVTAPFPLNKNDAGSPDYIDQGYGTDAKPEELEETDKLAVFSGVSQFPTRVKCAILPWHTLRSALEDKHDKITTESL